MNTLEQTRVQVKIWGCRGSMVTPGKRFIRYGGHTPCVQITSNTGQHLILDAGIGITQLFPAFSSEKQYHVLLTHTHWDHIQGLPYFPPMFFPGRKITIYTALLNSRHLGRIIAKQFSANYSPFSSIDVLAGMIHFQQIKASGVKTGPFRIEACPVNHEAQACAYRISVDNRVIVYAPDHEALADNRVNKKLLDYAEASDLLIHDAQYTPEEYMEKEGWGHSTWQNAVDNAKACNARRLLLFHHDYEHDDHYMDHILEQSAKYSEDHDGPPVDAAYDGMNIML